LLAGSLLVLASGSSYAQYTASTASGLFGIWPGVNVDQFNLNIAPDTKINASNVGTLTNIDPSNALGMMQIDPTAVGMASSPSAPVIDANGNVYIARGASVSAYTARGIPLWQTALTDETNTAEMFDSSPVLTKNFLFVGGRMMHKICINSATLGCVPGLEVAKSIYDPVNAPFIPAGWVEGSQLTVTPNGLVIYAVGYADEGFYYSTYGDALFTQLYPHSHGEIIAFRQSDLSTAWRIDLPSICADLTARCNYGAGISSFGGFGVDTKRSLLFIGTGNQYADTFNPPQPSPISDSLLAIDYTTGKIKWTYQFVWGDIDYGAGGSQTNTPATSDGRNDMDVHAHPQLFTYGGIDFVGAKGKDGTYRIFKRDQSSTSAKPFVQIKLEPGASADGGIQYDPVIIGGTMYIASTAWIEDANNPVDQGFAASTGYSLFSGRHTSLDTLSAAAGTPFASLGAASTTVRALNLGKLLQNGATPLPVCMIPANLINPNTTVSGALGCSGLLPSNFTLWTQTFRPLFPIASSGMTYDNGLLIVTSAEGYVRILDTANGGALVKTLLPAPDAPYYGPYLTPYLQANYSIFGVPVSGGVAAYNGRLYIPVGISFPQGGPNPVLTPGGLVIYGLPNAP